MGIVAVMCSASKPSSTTFVPYVPVKKDAEIEGRTFLSAVDARKQSDGATPKSRVLKTEQSTEERATEPRQASSAIPRMTWKLWNAVVWGKC